MKFYLDSAKEWEPYDDPKANRLMQNYWQKIEKETDAKVTFEGAHPEDYQHIIVDIPSMKALVQIMKAIGNDLVIEQQLVGKGDKYPTICVYDDYIEQEQESKRKN